MITLESSTQAVCNNLLDLVQLLPEGRNIGKLEYDQKSNTVYLGSKSTDGCMLNVKGLSNMEIVRLVLDSLNKIKKRLTFNNIYDTNYSWIHSHFTPFW